MFAIKNNTERLITTHLGDMLAPGATTEVSDVTMEHPTMQQMATDGFIEATEVVQSDASRSTNKIADSKASQTTAAQTTKV